MAIMPLALLPSTASAPASVPRFDSYEPVQSFEAPLHMMCRFQRPDLILMTRTHETYIPEELNDATVKAPANKKINETGNEGREITKTVISDRLWFAGSRPC